MGFLPEKLGRGDFLALKKSRIIFWGLNFVFRKKITSKSQNFDHASMPKRKDRSKMQTIFDIDINQVLPLLHLDGDCAELIFHSDSDEMRTS